MKGGKRSGAGRPAGAKDKKIRARRATPRAFVTIDAGLHSWISDLAQSEGISIRSWVERALRDTAQIRSLII